MSFSRPRNTDKRRKKKVLVPNSIEYNSHSSRPQTARSYRRRSHPIISSRSAKSNRTIKPCKNPDFTLDCTEKANIDQLKKQIDEYEHMIIYQDIAIEKMNQVLQKKNKYLEMEDEDSNESDEWEDFEEPHQQYLASLASISKNRTLQSILNAVTNSTIKSKKMIKKQKEIGQEIILKNTYMKQGALVCVRIHLFFF